MKKELKPYIHGETTTNENKRSEVNLDTITFGEYLNLPPLMKQAVLEALNKEIAVEKEKNNKMTIDYVNPKEKFISLAWLPNEMAKTNLIRNDKKLQTVDNYKKGKKNVCVKMSAYFVDENGNIIVSKDGAFNARYSAERPISPYDIAVMDAINTIYRTGNTNRFFSPSMIYKLVNGNTDKISKKALNDVVESIEKMRQIFCRIDYTDQAKQRKLTIEDENGDPITVFAMDDHLINVRHQDGVNVNGQPVDGYQILSQPILCLYSQNLKEVTKVPLQPLSITENGKRISDNKLRSIIKNYLYSRIAIMKGPTKVSKTIVYNTVLEQLIADTGKYPTDLSRTERNRHVDYINKCLNSFKHDGVITDFTEITGTKGKRLKAEIVL